MSAGVSRGMLIALGLTVVLSVGSIGVRKWRESSALKALQPVEIAPAPVVPLAPPSPPPAAPPPPAAAAPAPGSSPAPVASTGDTAAATTKAATTPPEAVPLSTADSTLPPQVGLRVIYPAATVDVMGGRRPAAPAPGPAPAANAEPAPPPPPPPPPPPSFRLIGRYVDGPAYTAFFAHGNSVIAARAGDKLPEDFVLKSVDAQGVAVLRSSNKEVIEMKMETP